MLTLWGAKNRSCDRVTRRGFLGVGALGLGGLTLADVLRLRAENPRQSKPRSVIMVCLPGGPSHIDMYDLKPDAPTDFRGEFKSIKTNVPGFDICEHMPKQSRIADKLALIRTVQFQEPMQHELEEVYTGFVKSARRPSFGAVISKYRAGDPRLPSYVSLEYGTTTTSYENPRYIGAAHRPLQLVGTEGVRSLGLPYYMPRTRLEDRRNLLQSFDTYRRDLDAQVRSTDMDAHTSRAFDIITSAKARDAFDINCEPDRVRERYVRDEKYSYVGNNRQFGWPGEKFLMARRLVEAGVPVVTLQVGQWDQHGDVLQANGGKNIWCNLETSLPLLDRSIDALVMDLHERGLEKEVLVLIWGEFGRTPKISQAGRDHHPPTSFALFAGGGLKMGQVVGETDSRGYWPKNRPLGAQNVLGTVYHALGIDYKQQVPDFTGRPMQLLEEGEPISELVG